MKIAIIDTTVHCREIGGGQLIVVPLLRGLSERGHEVHFISTDTPNELIRDNIVATGAAMHRRLWPANALVDDATPVFARWLNDLAADVHLISVSGDMGWTVLPLLDPSIATLTIGHNDERTFYDPVRHYAPFLTRAIGVSETICRKYVDESGMAPDCVEWIPYGVETLANFDANVSREAAGRNRDAPIRLAYVGRFENAQKRIADIVAIAQRLDAENISFKFDLIGDGEATPEVRSALSGLVERGSVRIHGWLASDKVIDKLRESEVFVLASAYEGFCISLIEAMANGCTPVVTDIESGNKQLVEDGVNGFVVPVGDIDAFVGKIRVLAGDRDRLLRMRSRSWHTGSAYSVERMVENYVACFERAVESARANQRTLDPEFPLMESCRSKYPLWLRRLKAKAKNLATN